RSVIELLPTDARAVRAKGAGVVPDRTIATTLIDIARSRQLHVCRVVIELLPQVDHILRTNDTALTPYGSEDPDSVITELQRDGAICGDLHDIDRLWRDGNFAHDSPPTRTGRSTARGTRVGQ